MSEDTQVDEASGLVPATTLPGALWVHNDSGDEPRLYAVARTGALLGRVDVTGAEATDWEDLAWAPAGLDGQRDLVIGDVGDNFGRRETVQLYCIPEPAADALGGQVAAVRVDVRLPEGPRDIEALFVDPLDGAAYMLTKNAVGASDVYRVALTTTPSSQPLRAEQVGAVGLPFVTAADISPDGTRIVIRNYKRALLFERAEGQSVAQTLAGWPCDVTLPEEPQGETIAFADDHSLVMLSEQVGQPVFVLREQQPRGATSVPNETGGSTP